MRPANASRSALCLILASTLAFTSTASAQGCSWERRDEAEQILREMNERLEALLGNLHERNKNLRSASVLRVYEDKVRLLETFPPVKMAGHEFPFKELFLLLETIDRGLQQALRSPGEEGDGLRRAKSAKDSLEVFGSEHGRFPKPIRDRLRSMNVLLGELLEDYRKGKLDRDRLRSKIGDIEGLKREVIDAFGEDGSVLTTDEGVELIDFDTLFQLLERIDLELINALLGIERDRPAEVRRGLRDAKAFKERLETRLREAGCLGQAEPPPEQQQAGVLAR